MDSAILVLYASASHIPAALAAEARHTLFVSLPFIFALTLISVDSPWLPLDVTYNRFRKT